MSMSGTVPAVCKKCNCRFVWHVDNIPFFDCEIVGICDNCVNKIPHDCVDEFVEDENKCFMVVGRKEFT